MRQTSLNPQKWNSEGPIPSWTQWISFLHGLVARLFINNDPIGRGPSTVWRGWIAAESQKIQCQSYDQIPRRYR